MMFVLQEQAKIGGTMSAVMAWLMTAWHASPSW
jgi:hypothetical protein